MRCRLKRARRRHRTPDGRSHAALRVVGDETADVPDVPFNTFSLHYALDLGLSKAELGGLTALVACLGRLLAVHTAR